MVRRTGVTRSRGTRAHQRGERTEVAVSRFPSIGEVGLLQRGQVSFFAEGYRSDATLGTVLKKEGVETLDQLLKK